MLYMLLKQTEHLPISTGTLKLALLLHLPSDINQVEWRLQPSACHARTGAEDRVRGRNHARLILVEYCLP